MKPAPYQTCRAAIIGARLLFIIALALGLGGWRSLRAQGVPERLNYQGLLLTGAGTPVTSPTTVEFRIWDTPTLTASDGLKWGRSFLVSPDANGLFSVMLSNDGGLVSGAPDVSLSSVFSGTNGAARYLELTVGGATAIRPRQQFVTAPYAFQSAGVVPIGGIIMWSGSQTNVPAGWHLCDGAQGTPNLQGRFVLASGSGSGLDPRSPGETGGKQTHILSIEEMPIHNHIWQHGTDSDDSGSGSSNREYTQAGGSDSTVIGNRGGGLAHTNMPPYYVLAFIMRVQ